MAQQQVISYQMDLFTAVNEDEVCHSDSGEPVKRAAAGKVLQMVTAGEQEHTFTFHLMEAILSSDNIKRAFKQVKQNKGASGIDSMSIQEFAAWYESHGVELHKQLYTGTYQPQGVREVEIPKPNGGTRKLGIPTVTYPTEKP